MKYFLFLLLVANFVSALEVDFHCPEKVIVNEEFSCSLKISESEGSYDVKIELEQDGKTAARIWNPEKNSWGSAYYYLKEFINEGEKEIKLKISSSGNYDGILKLRRGEKRDFFEFNILAEEVEREETEKKDVEREEKNIEKKIKEEKEIKQPVEKKKTDDNPIKLKKNKKPVEKKLIYESRNAKTIHYAPYFFSLFLIIIIFILIKERK